MDRGDRMIILGGAGFAGSGLVKKFLAKGRKVKVIDIISPHQAYNLGSVIDDPKLTWPARFRGKARVHAFRSSADVIAEALG